MQNKQQMTSAWLQTWMFIYFLTFETANLYIFFINPDFEIINFLLDLYWIQWMPDYF